MLLPSQALVQDVAQDDVQNISAFLPPCHEDADRPEHVYKFEDSILSVWLMEFWAQQSHPVRWSESRLCPSQAKSWERGNGALAFWGLQVPNPASFLWGAGGSASWWAVFHRNIGEAGLAQVSCACATAW